MNKLSSYIIIAAGVMLFNTACGQGQVRDHKGNIMPAVSPQAIKPVIVTEPVLFDTDDPAIWINTADASKSLIIGTDKNSEGAPPCDSAPPGAVPMPTGTTKPILPRPPRPRLRRSPGSSGPGRSGRHSA